MQIAEIDEIDPAAHVVQITGPTFDFIVYSIHDIGVGRVRLNQHDLDIRPSQVPAPSGLNRAVLTCLSVDAMVVFPDRDVKDSDR